MTSVMPRAALLVCVGLLLWAGSTLLLAEVRWFTRRPLTERLGPYAPGGLGATSRVGLLSVESFREAVGPFARSLGSQFSRLFGVREDLDRRLIRIHSDLDVTEFRIRQIGWSLSGLGSGALLVIVLTPPAVVSLTLLLGSMLLAFLLLEHQVTAACDHWKRTLLLELPIAAEQLAMLLGAGFSLMAALDRVARRGTGSVARDLRRVTNRISQGVVEERALREWAELAEIPAVDRLVAVLALNRDASDLGPLITDEARAIRRDVHRDVVETMERRGQQVWIPVTVATLLPGAIFIGIPFTAALGDFLG